MIRKIASVIKLHRKKGKISQQTLADIAGISRTAIQRLEYGEEPVQLDTFFKVCGALNLDVMVQSPLGDDFSLHLKAVGE